MTNKVQRIVVVGRDAEVWMTALALHRALAARSVEVTVLELPTQLIATDVYAAVPALSGLHRLLGAEQREVAAACLGVPMVGQRFSNWSRTAAPFLHWYDSGVDTAAAGQPDFLHYWVRGTRHGLRVPFEDFFLPAAAAKLGRIATSETADPGFQYDAPRYAGLWKHLALRSGIAHRTGRLVSVERDETNILAVHWEGGESFSADLFVDASGAEAILAGGMPGASSEDWSDYLPADRILSASSPPLSPLPPFSQVSAFRFGWVGLHPLQDRTALTGAFSSRHAEEDVLQGLSALAGAPIVSDITVTEFMPSGRAQAWIGNCVAIGRTALELEPLDAVQLHFAHLGIAHLVALLDSSIDPFRGADAFNATLAAHGRSLRDFQIAHYRLNRRFDEPMWDRVRDTQGPTALDSKTESFARDGTVPMQANESFSAANWAASLIGHGLMPQSYDTWVDETDEDRQKDQMQARLQSVADAARAAPTVEDYLGPAYRAAQSVEA